MILQDPDARLHQKARPLQEADPDSEREMLLALPADAYGLAAPQIGIAKQIVILNGGYFIYNLEVEGFGQPESGIEGCLSLPGRLFLVPRFQKILWSGRNSRWQSIGGTADGLLARVLQHEADHLQGILISEKGEEVELPQDN